LIDTSNIKSVLDLIKLFPDQQSCIDHLEKLRWGRNVVSPFDPDSKVYKCKGNRYRCYSTGKYFNVKTNTLFDNTKLPLIKWFLGIYIVTSHKKGISSVQLGKDLDITQKSAWFMLQRIRACFGIDEGKLQDEVEVDETYVGGKNKNRHVDKKVLFSQGRSYKDKTPVVGMIQRGGKLAATVVKDVTRKTLRKVLLDHIESGATLYSDEWRGYNGIGRYFDHSFIRHGQKEYANGNTHTNTIEGFWSILKRGIIGIYHYTSKKHLQLYLDEFVFRYNCRSFTEIERFNTLLRNITNRFTYKALING